MMKRIILHITALVICSQLHAQIDPLAEIQGKLSIYLSHDTTSVHIGRNAGLTQILSSGRDNTLVGTNAGQKITDGVDNSFFGTNSGQENQGGGQNSFFGANSGPDNQGHYNSFFGDNAGLKNTDGTENSFFGQAAGQENTTSPGNSFFGYQTGFNNMKGEFNSFFGRNAGYYNESGNYNSFFGNEAGISNKIGNQNSFFGADAGRNNAGILITPLGDTVNVGSNNSFFGHQSGYKNEAGQDNTFIGSGAGYHNLGGEMNDDLGEGYAFDNGGSRNVFLGNLAGYNNTTGKENIYLGNQAGYDNTTGIQNIMIGPFSGNKVLGSNNIFLGPGPRINANLPDSTINWRLYIGDFESHIPLIHGEFDKKLLRVNGRLEAGGEVVLENASDIIFMKADGTTEKAVLTLHSDNDTYLDGERHLRFRTGAGTSEQLIIKDNGNVGIGTAVPMYLLEVGVNGDASEARANAWNTFSDRRWKKDLESLPSILDNVDAISGYYYHWKESADKSRQIGLIAQEIAAVFPEIVSQDSKGYLSVDYSKMTPILLEAIKEQQAIIGDLQKQITDQQSRFDRKDQQFSALLSRIERLEEDGKMEEERQ